MPNAIGLKQRIREATSKMEVGALMLDGEGYEYASEHTRRQWQRVAKLRLQELKKEVGNDQKKKQ